MDEWQNLNDQIIGDAGETKREGRFTKLLQTKIDKDNIEKIEQSSIDGLKTTFFIVGTLVAVIVIAGLTTNWNSNFLSNSRL